MAVRAQQHVAIRVAENVEDAMIGAAALAIESGWPKVGELQIGFALVDFKFFLHFSQALPRSALNADLRLRYQWLLMDCWV